MNFYNDNDRFICAWLRELIKAKLIPDGVVDCRSIELIKPDELKEFTQCHFFCGIAGWPYALSLAGWPSDRPVWTGSCPCQPFSVGSVAHGGAKGRADERNLWPEFSRLIRQCKPPVVFGEQVASAIEWGWWDEACMDLEAEAYSVAAAVIPACAVGAWHERKRLWWVAHSNSTRREGHQPVKRIPESAPPTFSVNGDSFARTRRALDGDYSGLLPCDGISVQLERSKIKGYGNSIVPQVAAEFIAAYTDPLALNP